MNPLFHHIGKYFFHVNLGSRQDGFAWQEKLSQLFWIKLKPEMEALFDRVVGPDEVVRIEKLEIDLPYLKPGDLEDELIGKFIEKLETQLREQLANKSGPILRIPVKRSLFEAWLHYLEKGHLPWNIEGVPEEELQESVIGNHCFQ